ELGNYYKERQNPDLAISQYLLSIKMIKESNLYEILQMDYQGLYECYYAQGNIRKALEYHVLLLDVEKELLNAENNRQLAILHISFESETKEKDNQVLRKDIELKEMTIKRKTTFIWLIILAFASSTLLCILLYRRYYSKQKANRVLESLNSKITKQNRELEKLNSELEKANQEKDIVFSIITHELRNPLYWFQNLTEMLSKKYLTMKPGTLQKTLFALEESAKNAFHLMDNLLNWSRSRLKRITPKKGNYLLHSLVAETIQMYETILQYKDIRLQMKISDKVHIFADPDLFTCVLRNLVSNAIKYTPAHGTIDISCVEEECCFNIMVSDSGKGIPGKQLKRLFDVNEYFSSPGVLQEKGSGLGLKICAEFVELNNGKIWVSSEPEIGTTFCFTVPKAVPFIELETGTLITGLQNN
ncbi:MAG TPA: HAMP domain-containing sensor histidine kinase, partial [Bacteroidales bacterium]